LPLINLSMWSLAAATWPGLLSAAQCALAAMAGSILGDRLGVGVWTALVLTLAPAAAALGWRERSTVRSLLRGSDLISSTAEAFGG
jgi:hypothetical protein